MRRLTGWSHADVRATLAVVTALSVASSLPAGAQASVTESFSTGASSFVVPIGVSALEVHAVGGQGGRGYFSTILGGRAAVVDGTLAVSPAATLFLFTAGNGAQCGVSTDGAGYNGGGRSSVPCVFDGGGGGASDIRTVVADRSTRVLVAGGGGGGGDFGNGADAGSAPADAQSCTPVPQPGTAIAGGAGGATCGANPVASTAGSFGQGGDSAYRTDSVGNVENSGGGGGGGWYGGGGGTVYGGGAGGSSSTTGAVTGVLTSLAALGSTPVITLTYPGLTLSVGTAGAGAGFVDAPSVASSSPTALDCGRNTPSEHTDCAKEYRPGASVTLTAHPDTGTSDFAGFSGGGCSGTDPCTVTMDQARTVTATFTLTSPALDVTSAGTGAGYVDSSPAGIDCGQGVTGHAACATSYSYGTSVTLTAHPDSATSDFAGFSGGGCSGTDPCTVTMDQARTVTATFTLASRALDVGAGGTGAGFVDTSPTGIDCGHGLAGHAACATTYPHGTSVTLTAHPDAATSTFAGFSGGDCSGTDPCTVTMDQARTVTATFTLKPPPPPPPVAPPAPPPASAPSVTPEPGPAVTPLALPRATAKANASVTCPAAAVLPCHVVARWFSWRDRIRAPGTRRILMARATATIAPGATVRLLPRQTEAGRARLRGHRRLRTLRRIVAKAGAAHPTRTYTVVWLRAGR
jgi:hypothetical protein